jgi:hypothetical protein
MRRLPHTSFSEDLHQYLESYGASKLVAKYKGCVGELFFYEATEGAARGYSGLVSGLRLGCCFGFSPIRRPIRNQPGSVRVMGVRLG